MDKFEKALAENIEKAGKLGVNMTRIGASAQKFGAVKYIKEQIKRDNLGDGFDQLAKMGRLDLSWQALVIAKEFGDLFEDDEVNYCYMVLLDEGYSLF